MNGPTHIWSRPVVGYYLVRFLDQTRYYPGKEGSAWDVSWWKYISESAIVDVLSR